MLVHVLAEPFEDRDYCETAISRQTNAINIFLQPFFTACRSSVWSSISYADIWQNIRQRMSLRCMFTLAGVPRAFITSQTLALAHRNHPLAVSWAVDAWGCRTDGILHTDSFHLFESICYRLRKLRQALHSRRAGFVVHSGGEQCHARTHVLKGQVEAPPGQRPHGPSLHVDLQNTTVCDFVGGNGGYFTELAFTEVGTHVGICFRDVKVEGFFAGHRGAVKSVAVSHNKAELHRHARNPRPSLNERGA